MAIPESKHLSHVRARAGRRSGMKQIRRDLQPHPLPGYFVPGRARRDSDP